MSAAFWGFLGVLVTSLSQLWAQSRNRAAIRQRAKTILRDPKCTDDPQEAIEAATLETLRPRMRGESQKLRAMLNGTGPHPRVK